MPKDELPTAEAYDIWASNYDAAPNPMVALSEGVLQQLDLTPRRVLELGCGTGRNLARFAARGIEVAGVDLSQGMLAEARQKLPNADLRHGDIAERHDFGSVDLVLVALVLEHIEDVEPVTPRV